jgi:hypothetical protein
MLIFDTDLRTYITLYLGIPTFWDVMHHWLHGSWHFERYCLHFQGSRSPWRTVLLTPLEPWTFRQHVLLNTDTALASGCSVTSIPQLHWCENLKSQYCVRIIAYSEKAQRKRVGKIQCGTVGPTNVSDFTYSLGSCWLCSLFFWAHHLWLCKT